MFRIYLGFGALDLEFNFLKVLYKLKCPIYNKGQFKLKDNNMEKDKNIKDIEDINVFEQSQYLNFMVKKAEKIVTAIYLVTNLFPSNDPMKQILRKKSVFLLSEINHMRQIFDSTEVRPLLNLDRSISSIISLLNVSKDSRLISEMNHSILEKEIKNLANIYVNDNKITKSEILFNSDFFETNKKSLLPYQGPINDSQYEQKKERQNVGIKMSFRKNDYKMSFNNKTSKKKIIKRKTGPKQLETKEKRRDLIKSLVKSNKFITIKDATKLMPDYSEKTIQRELNLMVNEGSIRREGTRRWSKYYQI